MDISKILGGKKLVKKEAIWKRGLLDFSAAFFLIGGIIGLITIVMMIPISTIYPFRVKTGITFVDLIVLIVGAICAVEAFECYSFASRRMLDKAGIRGIVIGAILLSIGLIADSNVKAQMISASAILILIAGVISYIYRK